MKYAYRIVLVALAWPLFACDPLERTDNEQYLIEISLIDQLGVDSRRVLVGSSFTADIEELAVEGQVDPDGGGLLCATSSASGSLTKVGARFVVDAAGPGAVEYAAPIESCPANDDILAELGPDRWSMIGVEASAATGVWASSADSAAFGWGTVPGPALVFPDGFGRPLTDARVAAGGSFDLYPALVEQSVSERAEIRWNSEDMTLQVPADYDDLASYIDDEGVRHPSQTLSGSMRAGQSFQSSITVLDHEFAMPKVHAVPTERIASLQLVPVYAPTTTPERDWGPPIAVIAITRDAEGQRIVGPPVEWSVTDGRLIADESLKQETFGFDLCHREPKQPEWRGATIEASINGLLSVAELEWVALPSDDTDPRNPDCSACDCSISGDPRDSGLAMLALLGLGVWLRRRSSAHTSRSSAASIEVT